MKKILVALSILIASEAFAQPRLEIKENLTPMDGGDEYIAFQIALTNADHTGAGNLLRGIKIPDMTLKTGALGIAFDIGQGWHYGFKLNTNLPILFGGLPGAVDAGTMIYFDGTILSVSNSLKLYGDLVLNDTAIRWFDKLAFKYDDLTPGSCTHDETRIDNGGATKEFCQCDSGEWLCTTLRRGPMD